MNQSDLPNLTLINTNVDGGDHFGYIGSVILESITPSSFLFRYPKSQIG